MRRRLKWIRTKYPDDFKLMQTARGVKIKRDLPPGTLVYVNSRGNIKPMPEVFGMVIDHNLAQALNRKMYDKYGPNWREKT